MQELIERRNTLENELKALEKQIYDLETPYLEETQNTGNILVGWSNYLTNKAKAPIYPGSKKPKCSNNERLFSLSSTTSPASKEFQEEGGERSLFTGTTTYMPKRTKGKKNYAKVYDGSNFKEKRDISYSAKKEELCYDDDSNNSNSKVGKKDLVPIKKKIDKKKQKTKGSKGL